MPDVPEPAGRAEDLGVPSPCVKVCRLDDATGLCVGCLRSGVEIGAWREANDRLRRDILDRIAVRRAMGYRTVPPT